MAAPAPDEDHERGSLGETTTRGAWARSEVRVGTATVTYELAATTDPTDHESFTPDELIAAGCRTPAARPSIEMIAAVLATKRATLDALGTGSLLDAVVRFDEDDEPEVRLSADAAARSGCGADASAVRLTRRADEVSAVVALVTSTPLPLIPVSTGSLVETLDRRRPVDRPAEHDSGELV